MEGLDLNIENYATKELSEMFDLPSNYDRNILEKKETKLSTFTVVLSVDG